MNTIEKIVLAGILNVLFILPVLAQNRLSVDSSYLNSHYKSRLEFFRKMPDLKNEIVFLGNSLTEGGKWHELIPKKHVINRGISGDVTYGILARLDEILSSKPSKIFLLCGINDMKRGIPNAVIEANIERILRQIKSHSPKTKLYVQGLLPVNESMLPASYSNLSNGKIDSLNKNLEMLSAKWGASYISLKTVFADDKGSLRKELSIDGLHLRQASYILWANYLKKSGSLK